MQRAEQYGVLPGWWRGRRGDNSDYRSADSALGHGNDKASIHPPVVCQEAIPHGVDFSLRMRLPYTFVRRSAADKAVIANRELGVVRLQSLDST